MNKKKIAVGISTMVILFLAFIVTLGTTIYYAHFANIKKEIGVFEDDRNFGDDYNDFKGYVFKGSEFNSDMYFRVMLPTNYDENKSYPVLMFVHGMGAQGSNNKDQMQSDFIDNYLNVKDNFPAIIFIPQFPQNLHGNGNSMDKGASEYLLMSCLKAGILDRYNVDRRQIYATGVSMGGFTCVYLAEKYPDVFAAIVPLCGGTDGNPIQVAEKIKDIPTWFAHSQDDKVVHFSLSKNLYDAMVNLGASPKFTSYNDKGHNIASAFYAQEGFLEGENLWNWIFSQRKDN